MRTLHISRFTEEGLIVIAAVNWSELCTQNRNELFASPN
jgi:hypothetical protein